MFIPADGIRQNGSAYQGGNVSSPYFPQGAFLPVGMSGCILWLRADLGIHTATGVSQWDDQAGAGNPNLTQATGSKQPTLNASDASYNNKPTLSFASASVQSLQSVNWGVALALPRTIFVVGNFSGTATEQWLVGGGGGGSDGEIFNNTSATTVSMVSGATTSKTSFANGVPMVIGADFNVTASKLYVSAKTPVSGGANTLAMANVCLGNYQDGGAFPLNGKIAEFIIYNRSLSAAEVAVVLTYLGTRYAIAIGA